METIYVLNGPNLNLLGLREPDIYGTKSYAELYDFLREEGAENGIDVLVYQSNHEGALIDRLQAAVSMPGLIGVIINAGGYTHTSISLRDCIAAMPYPVVEVHLTDISKRESFRNFSLLSDVCDVTFMGEGFGSYQKAIHYLMNIEKKC